MVKGIHKRVIMVKSPDPRLFEQAIFIVKESPLADGLTQDDVLQEAQQVANRYLKQNSSLGKLTKHIPAPIWMAAGALTASAAWCATLLL